MLSTWFVFEQWTYVRFEGHKWLSDVLVEAKRDVIAQLWALWSYIHPRTVWRRGRSEVDRLFKQPGMTMRHISAFALSLNRIHRPD